MVASAHGQLLHVRCSKVFDNPSVRRRLRVVDGNCS